MDVFISHHPDARVIMVGLDGLSCVTSGGLQKFSQWAFPEWLYQENRWADYLHMFNLYALERAGQAFAEFTHLKPRVYGLDGYTRFTPPDSEYDVARAAAQLRDATVVVPGGARAGDPSGWDFVGLDLLAARLTRLAPATVKLLYFVPYYRALRPPPESPGARVWTECRRRAVALARRTPHAFVIDFMIQSAITDEPTNYWDGYHYRQPIADRIALDLAEATRASANGQNDYAVLYP
jgi:hypothetical protein